MTLKDKFEKLGATSPEQIKQIMDIYQNLAPAKLALAKAMIDPIRRRRFGGPWGMCNECGKPHWEPEDAVSHTDEECCVHQVMES